MNIITETPKPDGKRVLKVELMPGEVLVAVRPNEFYRLGEPSTDVIPGRMVEQMAQVYWCPLSQGWVA